VNMAELDPRQTQFLKFYLDPKSDTYSNALQSALKAGYKQEYAENITTLEPDWLLESIGRRKRILDKAEKRLENLLDSEDEKVVADLVKHTTKTLGKEYYSERTELTGKEGRDLTINIVKY
jgi:phage terminase small subunit